jgi:geranylgeranyl pyrophosphate synthase
VDALFANDDPDDAAVARVVSVVVEAGGIDQARQRGEDFAQQAEEALTDVADSPVRAALVDAITYVMDRRS